MSEQETGSGRPRRLLSVLLVIAVLLASIATTQPLRAAAFVVDSTADLADVNPGDGICATTEGTCTLRAAIQEANSLGDADTISIPAGTYTLQLAEGAEDPLYGDFDILAPLTIVGAGAGLTVLDGGEPPLGSPPNVLAVDRLFEIHPSAGNVTIRDLRVQGGWSAEDGGGIYNGSAGILRLEHIVLAENSSEIEGGGLYNAVGRAIVSGSASAPALIAGNVARGGGGLYNAGGLSPTGLPARVDLSFVTIANNSAATGGGVYSDHEGILNLADATVSDNLSEGDGGGVAGGSRAAVTIARTAFSGNRSVGAGGAVYVAAERALSIAGSTFTGNAAGVTLPAVPPELPVSGDGGGGALAVASSGTTSVTGSTFEGNSAVGDGGAILIESLGSVTISDSTVRDNSTESNGGGIENAGVTVSLERLQIHGNQAALDGGGIESQGSGAFTILDSNIYSNIAENGGGFSNNGDGTLLIARSTFWDNRALVRLSDDTGLGGGVYSLGDAAATYENVTISGNLAQVRGGGLYIDADAGVRVINSTLAYNSAPEAAGVGGEPSVPLPPGQLPYPSTSVIFRNTIVAGNTGGPACNFALGSEGGNIEDADSCYFRGTRDRIFVTAVGLDAVADNGGPTLTQALQPDSYALDAGVSPCVETDQRGVTRPQNTGCDSGAFESEGPFPPVDTTPPYTQYLTGPVQDTENTSLFTFTGSDNQTAAADLLYECRLLEFDPAEPPEPVDPTQPPSPEEQFIGCPTPWQVKLIEDGTWRFEVRAIDRAGNVDPTPAVYEFTLAVDVTPPETFFLETPPNPSFSNSATFTFGGSDAETPAQFLEFECRIDTNDPALWLECYNPAVFSNLTVGVHTVQVRATDAGDNVDPTPATYTWTVAPPLNCEAANVTLVAAEDSYVDEALPLDNYSFFESLIVRSQALGNNARALLRFDLPLSVAGCALESATLRLYADGEAGRTLEAVPVDATWTESQVTWNNQPAATGVPATTGSGSAYRQWNVTSHVEAMLAAGASDGWVIRDAAEGDETGAEQSFISSEAILEPPTPPQLVLRFEDSGAPAPPPPAEPVGTTSLVCGQVITQSVRLAGSVLGCLGEGLVIGAPNLVVDLNGFTLDSGLVVDPGAEEGMFAGVRNSGHSNVIIRNGTIRDFGFGVQLLAGTTYNLVTGVTFTNNIIAGVELRNADNGRNGNTISGNSFSLNGVGVQILDGSEGSLIENNDLVGNLGVALYMYDSSRNRIANNTVSGVTGDPLLDSDGGLYLEASSENEIVGNEIADAGDAGILLTHGSNDNLIQDNTVYRTSDSGIALDESDGNRVLGNTTHQTGGAGISLGDAHGNEVVGNDVRFNPGGVELAGSNDNLIEANDASYSGAAGISAEGGTGNIIVNNLASGTGADGISVEAETLSAAGNPIGGFLIEGNTANDNLGDGISVGGSGHTIRANSAYNNLAYGIRASAGNVDGGGNLAAGNAEPPQCVGVVCSPGAGPPPSGADLTPPDTVIVNRPPSGSSTLDPAVFTFTGSDNLAPPTALTFECRLDAPPDPPPPPPDPGDPPQPPDVDNWLPCVSPVSYSFLLAGEHTFEVRARDPGDNIDLTPAVYTWTVVAAPPGADNTPPNTTITATPSNPTTSTSATFRFTGSDNATPGPNLTFGCSLDGGPFTLCTSPVTYDTLVPGEHTFAVMARDAQGNLDPTPASFTWTIEAAPPDTTAPDTTITAGPDATTVSTSASFSFSSNEAGASFECALDGGAFAPCASPETFVVGVGAHQLQVRAVDAAGNVDPSPATYSWTVTPAPVALNATCGQVITQSIILQNTLLGCLENGLVVGASNITIDLNGQAIEGAGLGAGILNNGFDGVTVVNGTVRGFDVGLQLNAGASLNIIADLAIELNLTAGVALANADEAGAGNLIRNNLLSGNGDGIWLSAGTQGATLLGNEIAASSGTGLRLEGSSGNRVEGNEIASASDQGLVLTGSSNNTVVGNTIFGVSDAAFLVEQGSHGNRIEGNLVQESEAGIIIEDSNGNELLNNRVTGSSDNGLTIEDSNNNVVRGNDVRFNTGGIEVGGSGNLIENNNASETDGYGIEIGDGSFNNTLRGNIASGNAAAGISVGGDAPPGSGNLIERNVASGNAGDGIHVAAVGHIITANSAHNNGDYGIYASAGTIAGMNIDGGGNRASGNGGGGIDPLTGLVIQCYNIQCDGGPGLPGDTTAPETFIAAGPSNPTSFTSTTFSFNGFDNASAVTFQCSLDGAAFAPCTSPATYSDLALGAHTFAVRAVDYLGNTDASPASFTWTIEAPAPGVPPDTTITARPDPSTPSTTASFSFAANEEGATFECLLDGGSFAPCTSPQLYTGLAGGPHTFTVRAVDLEGLPDPTPASFSWTITGAPVPTTVSCGQVLTQSTLLQNDLLDCLANGLVVGASNITIDLNGHTIDGTGIGAGILNNGHDGVSIVNGVVQEFDFGVQLNAGTAGNVVAGLTVQLSQDAGIQLVNADQGGVGNTVSGNTVLDSSGSGIALIDGTSGAEVRNNIVARSSGAGIYLLNSGGNSVEANSVSESGGAGITLEGSSDNLVLGNTLSDTSGGGISLIADPLLAPSNNNRVEGNTVERTGGAGVEVVESSSNQLIDNTVHEASTGISLELAQSNLVRGNDLRNNSGGIALDASGGNLIEQNNVSASSGTGISLEGLSLNNVVHANTLIGNAGGGIYVGDVAAQGAANLITGNIASSSSGDGIFVAGGGHTVTGNTVNFNDGWGIYAEAGTVDGGGNMATGNVEPDQCFGVVCTIGVAPGAPDTDIVERPNNPSASRNARFTFTGADDTTPVANLGFQCRLDSSDPLAWVDCDNPQQYFDLAPGVHTFEVRAVDAQENVDPTPASYTWEYVALPPGVAPDTFIDLKPPVATPLYEALFTFSSNEPDVRFECSLDGAPFTACGNEPEMIAANYFVIEYEFEEFQVGLHTFRVRAIDVEGNVDQTPASWAWSILGVIAEVTDGPAYIPPEQVGEPAEGGETEATDATFTFIANIADSTFWCSLDLGPFVECSSGTISYSGLAIGEHLFRVYAVDPEGREQLEPTEYGWTILPSLDVTPPNTFINSAPASGTSDVVFTFSGQDNVTSPAGLTFECSLDGATFVECASPLNLYSAFPGFAPGTYTFSVQALDVEGNVDPTPATHTWTAAPDTVAPTVTLLTTPVSPTILLEGALTFSAADNATPAELLTFECALDGAAPAPCTSPYELQVEPGLRTVTVRAIDLALNAGPAASFTWLVVGPPETTIVSGPPATTTDTTATFTFVADQAGVTFACSLNSSAFAPCASPFTLTGLGGGGYTLAVQATNSFGLVEIEPTLYSWTVTAGPDVTPPDTSFVTTPTDPSNGPNATFSFVSSELGSSFECQIDGLGFSGCDSPATLQDLFGGSHTFEVRAVDPSGNVDPTPASFTWTVIGPPVTTILSGPDPVTEATLATFTFESTVPGSTFECSLDGAPAVACSSPWSYTALSAGPHVFLVYATAPGGFVDADGPEYQWEVVDLETTLTGGPALVTLETGASFSFSSPVPGATFNCSLDGAPFSACESPVELVSLAPGTHSFAVQAVSPLGGVDLTPAFYAWTIQAPPAPDTTPPNTAIATSPVAVTTQTGAIFTFTASEVDATFECSLDGEPFSGCSSPVELVDLELGEHSFEVRAVDAAGNVDPTPASLTWTIELDTLAPETSIDAGPIGNIGDSNVVFSFSGSDNHTALLDLAFECSLDEAPFEACQSPLAIQDLELGAHTFAVRAVDEAGNVDATPATRSWSVVDLAAPDTTITAGPADPTEIAGASFSFAADEPGATFECALDGADFAPCTSPAAYSGLSVGAHSFRVRAVDAAGNADPTPALYQWTVVAPTPPNTTISAGPPATTTQTTATFAFTANEPGVTFECALDGSAFAECETPYELTDLAVGPHTLEVRAIDPAGNVDPTPAVYEWTVLAQDPADTTPPETTITSGPPSASQATTAGFSFAASEVGASFECALDGAAFAPCVSPQSYTQLGVGAHTFLVRATDQAGNLDPSPASYSWTVLVPPACAAQTLVYSVEADAWIDQGSPDSNNGSDSNLKVQGKSGSDNFRALVRFALPSAIPAGCEVEAATLRLFASSATTGRTLQALRLSGTWGEGTVTWGNQPATAGAAATATSALDYREWDVTAQVEAIFAAGANHGFLIRDAAEGSGSAEQQFNSREKGETMPELVLRFMPGNVVDSTAPETTVLSGPASTTSAATASFVFGANEAGVSFECRLDGAAFAACSSPVELSGLTLGAHTFRVRAIDPSGNVDPTPASYSWTVTPPADTTPPETTIVSGPLALTESTSASFSFTAGEPAASFQCSLNGGTFTPCSSPAGYSGLTPGAQIFAVRAIDPVGNADPTPASYSWTVDLSVDTTPPDTTIGASPDATTTSTSATFSFSAGESGATFACSLDGAAFAACTSPLTLAGLDVGEHSFAVRATDAAGNADPTPAVFTWTVVEPPDTIAPQTSFTDGPADPSTSTSASFSFTGSDNRTAPLALSFECALDGAAFAPCTAPAELTALSLGEHTFAVRAVDEAGNADPTPATFTWMVEQPPTPVTPPETSIDAGPAATTTSTSASFSFSSDTAGATFECSLDGAAFAACASPQSYSGLAVGAHTFSVRAVVGADNADPTPASLSWTVAEPPDTVAPETTLTGQPAATTGDTTATFSFTGSDDRSEPLALSFQCRLDGGSFTACSSPVALSGLSLGSHTFAVRAVDEAGNADLTPATFTWTVTPPPDTTAPETTVGSGPAASTTSTSASFSFSADEPGVSFECKLDAGAFGPCSSPQSYSGLAVGPHTFAVRAIDAAGNADPTPATYTWTVQAPVACTAGTVTLTASADAWVDQNSSSNNFGSDSTLKVQAKTGNNFRALVRFTMPATVPAGCQIATATLRLNAGSATGGRTIQAIRLAGAWSENSVTWNNQPATVGAAATTTSGTGNRTWNVTTHVRDMYAAGANNGFLIRDASESGGGFEQQFYGRENSNNRPTLIITYEPSGG